MMGKSAGMTRRIVALFNTSMRMKVKEAAQWRAETTSVPLVPLRARSAESIRV